MDMFAGVTLIGFADDIGCKRSSLIDPFHKKSVLPKLPPTYYFVLISYSYLLNMWLHKNITWKNKSKFVNHWEVAPRKLKQ